jgi:hypothetical protein
MNKELKGAIVRKYGTQYPFAHELGIRESIVSAVIRGKHTLEVEEKKLWAETLGVSAKKLFAEEK